MTSTRKISFCFFESSFYTSVVATHTFSINIIIIVDGYQFYQIHSNEDQTLHTTTHHIIQIKFIFHFHFYTRTNDLHRWCQSFVFTRGIIASLSIENTIWLTTLLHVAWLHFISRNFPRNFPEFTRKKPNLQFSFGWIMGVFVIILFTLDKTKKRCSVRVNKTTSKQIILLFEFVYRIVFFLRRYKYVNSNGFVVLCQSSILCFPFIEYFKAVWWCKCGCKNGCIHSHWLDYCKHVHVHISFDQFIFFLTKVDNTKLILCGKWRWLMEMVGCWNKLFFYSNI